MMYRMDGIQQALSKPVAQRPTPLPKPSQMPGQNLFALGMQPQTQPPGPMTQPPMNGGSALLGSPQMQQPQTQPPATMAQPGMGMTLSGQPMLQPQTLPTAQTMNGTAFNGSATNGLPQQRPAPVNRTLGLGGMFGGRR